MAQNLFKRQGIFNNENKKDLVYLNPIWADLLHWGREVELDLES